MSVIRTEDVTRRRAIASVIGGIGGAAYLALNAPPLGQRPRTRCGSSPSLPWAGSSPEHGGARAASPRARAGRAGFGAGYWAVVALEAVLIFGGRADPRRPARTDLGAFLPWLSLVVGLHFFAFVKVFHKRTSLWLGLLISASGDHRLHPGRLRCHPRPRAPCSPPSSPASSCSRSG